MKSMKNKPVLLLITALLGVLIYQMFSGGGSSDSENKARKDEDQALAALFGGGGAAPSSSEQSVFGSDFWSAAVPENALDAPLDENGNDTGLLEPVSEGNPVNPQTGQPYPDTVMRQFDALRKKFPTNQIIPRRLSEEEKAKEQEKENQIAAIRNLMAQNQASESDINAYYDFETKKIDDRLELVNYILKEQGDAMSEEIRGKFENVLQMNQNQKDANEKARSAALGKIGASAPESSGGAAPEQNKIAN